MHPLIARRPLLTDGSNKAIGMQETGQHQQEKVLKCDKMELEDPGPTGDFSNRPEAQDNESAPPA